MLIIGIRYPLPRSPYLNDLSLIGHSLGIGHGPSNRHRGCIAGNTSR
jgi:hypothetical protein